MFLHIILSSGLQHLNWWDTFRQNFDCSSAMDYSMLDHISLVIKKAPKTSIALRLL